MKLKVSTTEARKRFAEITDDVRTTGKTYSIMRHGKEIARIVPAEEGREDRSKDKELQEDIKRFFSTYGDALKELADR